MKPEKIILLKNSRVKVVYDTGSDEIIKAHGILMRPWGIKATLEGRKTQTRRIRFSGHPGELVYIREPHYRLYKNSERTKFVEMEKPEISGIEVLGKLAGYTWKKKPSIHMPREYARYWLYIEDVHKERLQDITEKDAEKEGMKYFASATGMYTGNGYIPIFSYIWNRINGNRRDKQRNLLPYSWVDNPEIYVVTYRLFFTGRGICE